MARMVPLLVSIVAIFIVTLSFDRILHAASTPGLQRGLLAGAPELETASCVELGTRVREALSLLQTISARLGHASHGGLKKAHSRGMTSNLWQPIVTFFARFRPNRLSGRRPARMVAKPDHPRHRVSVCAQGRKLPGGGLRSEFSLPAEPLMISQAPSLSVALHYHQSRQLEA